MNIREELRRDLDGRRTEVELPDLTGTKTLRRIRVKRFGVVMSALALGVVLVGTGFVVFRSLGLSEQEQLVDPAPGPTGDWSLIEPAPLDPPGHLPQRSFWTGESLLVINGGHNSKPMEGAVYDPSQATWHPIADSPLGRRDGYSAVWTGQQLIIWGGAGVGGVPNDWGGPGERGALNDGAAYDLETDEWTMLPNSPLSGRSGHTAIWTGTQMIVQGGSPGVGVLPDGAVYDPDENSWTSISPAPEAGRAGAVAVWTGSQMALWGGVGSKGWASGGLLYAPDSDTWMRMSNSPLAGRLEPAGLWTGQEFIVWGGSSLSDGKLAQPTFSDGAAYDASDNSWRLLSPSPLAPRARHAFVWTGTHAIFWGGTSDASFETYGELLDDGAVYDPDQDSWLLLPKSPLEARALPSAVWTGRDVIVWGGCCVDHFDVDNFLDGATLTP